MTPMVSGVTPLLSNLAAWRVYSVQCSNPPRARVVAGIRQRMNLGQATLIIGCLILLTIVGEIVKLILNDIGRAIHAHIARLG